MATFVYSFVSAVLNLFGLGHPREPLGPEERSVDQVRAQHQRAVRDLLDQSGNRFR